MKRKTDKICRGKREIMFPVYEEKKKTCICSSALPDMNPHLHNSVEFIYLTEGCLESEWARNSFHMEEGDFAVLFPEVIHHCQVFQERIIRYYIRGRSSYLRTICFCYAEILSGKSKIKKPQGSTGIL